MTTILVSIAWMLTCGCPAGRYMVHVTLPGGVTMCLEDGTVVEGDVEFICHGQERLTRRQLSNLLGAIKQGRQQHSGITITYRSPRDE